MSDMIQTGLAWLTAKRAAFAATPCVLKAESVNFSIHATLTKRQVEVTGEGGATMIAEVMTAIFPVSELTAGYRPKNGDKLTGTGIAFEVRAPSAGTQAWTWADAHQTAIRMFLREYNAEHAPG